MASDPWTEVGTPARPSWVDASTERRLRLLSALPAMKDSLQKQASGYFDAKGPGMTVGLVLDDGLFYSQGWGFADADKKQTPDEYTIFRAGSLSKVMTGTALLTLIDDPSRKMSLGDAADAARYLPELKFVCPQWNHTCKRGAQHTGVLLKHLVSHTAGLADVLDQTHADVATWLADLKKSWLLFKPGTFGAYSGVGVEGVGLIEQRVSGELYVDFVKKNLFAPLGMTSSTMNPLSLPAKDQAQKWQFSASGASWSFTPFDAIIAGDNQAMILPAGGLTTNVRDLSLFIHMWLSGKAPEVDGRPLLKPATIQSAGTSMFSATTAPPKYCAGSSGETDASGFFYSPCGTAYGFGVTWYVGQVPYLQHNGDEPGLSGSNTVVDQPGKMGATGLISTEPFPGAKPQPKGLDSNFMGDVVFGLLTSGLAADKATSWSEQTLADGVARVLYLSGKQAEASDLGDFQASFLASEGLKPSNIVGYLNAWHALYGSCSSFRVRAVDSATKIAVRFVCQKWQWDVVLEIESASPHRIAWTETGAKQIPSPLVKCDTACSLSDGQCMGQAHSSSERQACVQATEKCQAACK
jgi:CubicO group peptidase (beta-lactamase class C family)